MLPAKKAPKDGLIPIIFDNHKNVERKRRESTSIFSLFCGIKENIILENFKKINI